MTRGGARTRPPPTRTSRRRLRGPSAFVAAPAGSRSFASRRIRASSSGPRPRRAARPAAANRSVPSVVPRGDRSRPRGERFHVLRGRVDRTRTARRGRGAARRWTRRRSPRSVMVSGASITSRSTVTPCQAWIVNPSPNASAGPLSACSRPSASTEAVNGRSLTMARPSSAHHGPADRASWSRSRKALPMLGRPVSRDVERDDRGRTRRDAQ